MASTPATSITTSRPVQAHRVMTDSPTRVAAQRWHHWVPGAAVALMAPAAWAVTARRSGRWGTSARSRALSLGSGTPWRPPCGLRPF